jgi:hypothetical protein
MRLIFFFIILSFSANAQTIQSPLAEFSREWSSPEYQSANTAIHAAYMTQEEKSVIYVLNLARMNPGLFMETVIKSYATYSGNKNLVKSRFYKSLLSEMGEMKSLPLLVPDEKCFQSASCHASSSGKFSYVGHVRQTKDCKKTESYKAECCSYGFSKAIDIIVTLLIDEGVASLAHRNIMFSLYYKAAVSIQPHKEYQTNTVIDFAN